MLFPKLSIRDSNEVSQDDLAVVLQLQRLPLSGECVDLSIDLST